MRVLIRRFAEWGINGMVGNVINEGAAWKKLNDHFNQVSGLYIRDLFAADPQRFQKFSCEYGGLLLDYSKNRVTDVTLEGLVELAREADVEGWRDRLFRGEPVSTDGPRAVALHPVLRDDGHGPAAAARKTSEAAANKAQLYKLCEDVRAGRRAGFSGKPFRDVVCIGIGGSYLGPAMACRALKHLAREDLRVFFVTTVDACQMSEVLNEVNIEQTLFIVTSKTFTTQETLVNAARAKDWVRRRCGAGEAWRQHFVAVTANAAAAIEFGMPTDNVLTLWNTVGGRFSLWSAVGLPLAILLGSDRFEALLAGACSMDKHFAEASPMSNMPMILALLDIWYVNFYGASSRAVLPYDHALRWLPEYLQQLEMESNGKSVDRDGRALTYATAPVVWGKSGPEGQHAFYQLLHQGGRLVPSDFIITAKSAEPMPPHDDVLRANFLAQTHALMYGDGGAGEGDAQRRNPGNQPSNALVLDTLSPFTLGLLLALYEHKVFVQAMIWNINPFDQWGVELGKRLAAGAFAPESDFDGSTCGLRDRLSGHL